MPRHAKHWPSRRCATGSRSRRHADADVAQEFDALVRQDIIANAALAKAAGLKPN